QFNRTFFRVNRIRVAGVRDTLVLTGQDTYKSDREMTICEMRGQVEAARRDQERAQLEAGVAVESDLRRLAGLAPVLTPLRAAPQRAAGYEVEIHKKCAIAAACIIFALVGAPVGLRFQRGGVGLVIGVSLAVFTVYYIGLIGGEELGDRLLVSPFFAMWTPN